VGGPNQNDEYPDSVSDYTTSEVADDYNAGFVGILARLYSIYGGQTLKDFGAVETPTDDEIFVEAGVNVKGDDFIEIRAYVYNESAWPARVAENISLRYFVDLTEVYEAGGSVDNLVVTTNYTEGASASGLIPWDEENHIYYVNIDFTGTKIYPGGQSSYKKEVQFRIRNEQGVWDNSNDPSFADLTNNNGSTMVRTGAIVLYDGTEKIFGNEP
jgi:endoglucanase